MFIFAWIYHRFRLLEYLWHYYFIILTYVLWVRIDFRDQLIGCHMYVGFWIVNNLNKSGLLPLGRLWRKCFSYQLLFWEVEFIEFLGRKDFFAKTPGITIHIDGYLLRLKRIFEGFVRFVFRLSVSEVHKNWISHIFYEKISWKINFLKTLQQLRLIDCFPSTSKRLCHHVVTLKEYKLVPK